MDQITTQNESEYVQARSEDVLDKAKAIVYGPRQAEHGKPIDNHTRTATMWGAYLGIEITARDVCMLNILQKVSRDAHKKGEDNLIDIAGYTLNAELVENWP